MKLYRIENKNGYGPWAELDGHRGDVIQGEQPNSPMWWHHFTVKPYSELYEAIYSSSELPAPSQESGMMLDEYWPGVIAWVACVSLEQLGEWFPPAIIRHMEHDFADFGYRIAELEVPENAVQVFRWQAVYDPDKVQSKHYLPLSVLIPQAVAA